MCCMQNNQFHNITPLFGCIPWDHVSSEHNAPLITGSPPMGITQIVYYKVFNKQQ